VTPLGLRREKRPLRKGTRTTNLKDPDLLANEEKKDIETKPKKVSDITLPQGRKPKPDVTSPRGSKLHTRTSSLDGDDTLSTSLATGQKRRTLKKTSSHGFERITVCQIFI
jgi:hypothetical protein